MQITFVQVVAAKALLGQHLANPISVDGQPVDIIYTPDDTAVIFDPDTTLELRLSISLPQRPASVVGMGKTNEAIP